MNHIWSHEFTWYHFVDWCRLQTSQKNAQEPFESQLLAHAECLTHVRCFAPVANMTSHEVQQQKQLRNTWVTHCTTRSAGFGGFGWFGLVWTVCRFDEMLMPRSSVRSMRTTSPHISGRSGEKLVKTQQQGLPGRNSAICRSVSVAFKCRGPLEMRRLPCHGPGLRKLCLAANLCQITINYSTLVIVLIEAIIWCCTVTVAVRCSW